MAFLASIRQRTDLRVQGVAKESDDRDPSTITDIAWIAELHPKRFTELQTGGKWMQFYDHDTIWPHWRKCQQLYRANQLKGVSNMKVSTMHPLHASGVGVICLYCGGDERMVKEIGRNILLETGYTHISHKMYYKTDTQTLSKGTAGWHKYELTIPQINLDKAKNKPINKAIPANHPKIDHIAATDIKYTKQYLESLSKSEVIDLVMEIQRDSSPKEEHKSAPNPSLLAAIAARKPKEKAIHIKYGEFFAHKKKFIKIIAISDTHMQHHKLNMPKGDILVLSGDYTNEGTLEEAKQVNEWIGAIRKKKKYKHVLLINGNHEGFGDIVLNEKYLSILKENNKLIHDEQTLAMLYEIYNEQVEQLRKVMTNCVILNDEAIVVENIKFYGSSWTNHTQSNYGLYLEPKYIANKWANIPKDCEYLITHCPPQGILDRSDHSGCSQLRMALNGLKQLKVHQFGHVHGVIDDHQFITKQSLQMSVEEEKTRVLHKNGKPWFYLLDRDGDKLVKYKQKHMDKLDSIQDCVLFINAVNDGVKQANWLHFPIQN